MPRVWISLGSNIEPERQLPAALTRLRAEYGPLSCSPVYRTRAVGFEGPDFLNMVAGFESAQPPAAIRQRLRQIEDAAGRVREGDAFSSRTLDLDLLTYGDLVIDQPPLQLPRDEILQQPFVLGPLAQVAPHELHPLTGRSYGELWAEAPPDWAAALVPVRLPLADYC